MSTAKFDKLHDHIWIRVLEMLTPSLPKPLSGWTKEEAAGYPQDVIDELPSLGDKGTTARQDIKADALAKLMRTSLAFNHLASRPLYKRVITDELQLLTALYSTPKAHPSILSKSQLLAQTTHLHIEYRLKTGHPSYIQLLGDPSHWGTLGANSLPAGRKAECEFEYKGVYKALRALERHTPFPCVSHMSIGAVFGSQDRVWKPLANRWNSMGQETEVSVHRVLALLARMPLQFICSRSGFGPLALPHVFGWQSRIISTGRRFSPPIPTFIFHYEAAIPNPSVATGCQTRIVLETAERVYTWDAIKGSLYHLIPNLIDEVKKKVHSGHIKLDIYSSSQRMDSKKYPAALCDPDRVVRCTDGQERRFVRELQEEVGEYRKQGGGWPGEGDALRMSAWIDAPPCEACCWVVDRAGDQDRGDDDRLFMSDDFAEMRNTKAQ